MFRGCILKHLYGYHQGNRDDAPSHNPRNQNQDTLQRACHNRHLTHYQDLYPKSCLLICDLSSFSQVYPRSPYHPIFQVSRDLHHDWGHNFNDEYCHPSVLSLRKNQNLYSLQELLP